MYVSEWRKRDRKRALGNLHESMREKYQNSFIVSQVILKLVMFVEFHEFQA